MFELISACRSCGAERLEPVLSLGETPLADKLVEADAGNEKELRFPLDVVFCEECSLVQLAETVSPEILFGDDYPYFSSFSYELLDQARRNSEHLIADRNLNASSLVVEIASNDGYLLRWFAQAGIPVLGIDPAPGPVRAARAAGVPTKQAFFGADLATLLRAEGNAADVIVANNVLAHVADVNGFVRAIRTLLKERGVAVFEVPYVANLIEGCEFDTIYHEHLCYFSVTALNRLFRRHGLFLNRLRHLSIHGGSLRLFVESVDEPDGSVAEALAAEEAAGLDGLGFYLDFSERVERVGSALVDLLRSLRDRGAVIAAYGAAAKGATLLNFTGIGRDTLAFVVDRNVHKHGKLMPGVRVPIRDPSALLTEMPEYTLLLAWNFADEILSQQAEYRRRGGKFIVPVPTPQVI